MTEAPNELGLVQHVCSNLHTPHAVHGLKHLHQLRLCRCHSGSRGLDVMSLVLSHLQTQELAEGPLDLDKSLCKITIFAR